MPSAVIRLIKALWLAYTKWKVLQKAKKSKIKADGKPSPEGQKYLDSFGPNPMHTDVSKKGIKRLMKLVNEKKQPKK